MTNKALKGILTIVVPLIRPAIKALFVMGVPFHHGGAPVDWSSSLGSSRQGVLWKATQDLELWDPFELHGRTLWLLNGGEMVNSFYNWVP